MRHELIFAVAADQQTAHALSAIVGKAGFLARGIPVNDLIPEVEAQSPALLLMELNDRRSPVLGICRRIREHATLSDIPIVLMLDHSLEHLRLEAFRVGADDCLVQPCGDRELAARIQAVLRRTVRLPVTKVSHSNLWVDVSAMKIAVNGEDVLTTTLEFRLLAYLAKHQGRVLSRDMLLDAVWGEMRFVTPRTVDACIRRIRKKIERDRSRPSLLTTLRGAGYRLDAAVTWQVATPNDACDCPICTGTARPRNASEPLREGKRAIPGTALVDENTPATGHAGNRSAAKGAG